MEHTKVSRLSRFTFLPVHERISSSEELVVYISGGIANKSDLLAMLAQQLDFPDYFGFNWDALEECLYDLEWLKVEEVTIVHNGVPLQLARQDLRIYLEILLASVQSHKAEGPPHLTVIFPPESRKWLEDFLE